MEQSLTSSQKIDKQTLFTPENTELEKFKKQWVKGKKKNKVEKANLAIKSEKSNRWDSSWMRQIGKIWVENERFRWSL